MGANLNNLTVDDSTIALSSGTTYNGSASVTVSVKNAGITNAKLENSTISGVALGANLNGLSVDDSTIEYSTGTTYNGSAASAIRIKDSGITTAKLASDIGVTRTLTAYASASSNKVESGAIAIPAGSLLTKIIAIVTTQLDVTDTSNNTTIKVGTDADGDQIASAVNIQAFGSSDVVDVGKGSSTDTAITTNLSGVASISLKSGTAYIVNNTDIHITVENASNISAGAVSFVVEYIKLKTS